MKYVDVDDILLIKQKMFDSVIRITFTGVLHVNHKSRPGFTNAGIRVPDGVGSVAILTLACGLHHVPVSQSEAHCLVAEPYVVIQ